MERIKRAQPEYSSVYCDPASTNARRVFGELPLALSESPSEADLLWIQKGPGLSLDDPVKQTVISPMLAEAIYIVLEVRRRLKIGESLGCLKSVSGFEWVINEAS